MTAPSIHIHQASLAYNGQPVFSELSFTLPAGKWVALLGPSGIGKSSLLRMIASLTTANETTTGEIRTGDASPIQEQIAYMAQTDLLLPWLTVLQNACLGSKLRAHARRHHATSLEQAKKLLHQVGLGDKLHLYPAQLSGGMRQRVALVRTLMEKKAVVLMDEPFSALDAITRYKLQALAAELLVDKTVLFVTHDPSEALRLAHVIYIMQAQPAYLKCVTELHSPTPRPLTDAETMPLQSLLYQELLQTTAGAA